MSCFVMVFEKDGRKFYDSRPLAGVVSVNEVKIRTEGLYTLQDMEKGLKIGDVKAVYLYNLGVGPVNGDFSNVIPDGFNVVEEIPTYDQWKTKKTQLVGGKKPTKKPAAKKTVAKKPAAKKVVKKTK